MLTELYTIGLVKQSVFIRILCLGALFLRKRDSAAYQLIALLKSGRFLQDENDKTFSTLVLDKTIAIVGPAYSCRLEKVKLIFYR